MPRRNARMNPERLHRLIIESHMAGNGYKTIASVYHVSLPTVRKIIRRWKGPNTPATHPPHQAGEPAEQYSDDGEGPSAAPRMDTDQELPGVLVEEIGGPNGVMEEHVDFLKQRFTLITLQELKDNTEELAEKIVCIFNWGNKPNVDSELLRCLPNLKVIACRGNEIDHLDLKMISGYGVKVTNTPHAVISSTADLAMTLLLVSARNFMEAHQIAVSPSTDRFSSNWAGGDITRKTLGIVGMGKIGSKIAERARAFEMKILYYNRRRRIDDEQALGAVFCAQLIDLLRQSDFVMLVNLNFKSEKLIGRCELNLMKPSAILINVNRGLVVDQDALVEALETGRIKAAALDVTYPQPLPRDHPLLKLRNVLLTPYMGSATPQSRRLMMEEMVQNMTEAVNGLPLSSAIFLK